MTRQPRSGASGGDYAIGYGRPPIATRFQLGRSGNPRGRPRGLKSIGKLLEEALSRRIVVHENGRERRIRMQEAIIQGLVNEAARRNASALKLLFLLLDRYGQSGASEIDAGSLQPDDRAIIDSFLASLQIDAQTEGPKTTVIPETLDGAEGR